MKLSPMMEQYMDIKDKYKDCILFFRLGDFYEMFYEDAKLCSKKLELTLTGKNCGQEERAPMCGVPFHAADTYIAKLVEMGYKVAICEQVEDPQAAKGIVKREVIKIVTPGTVTSSAMLNEKENNYLASVYFKEEGMSISYCDISTGELLVTEETHGDLYQVLLNELVKIKPKEILINDDCLHLIDQGEITGLTESFINFTSASVYTEKAALELIKAQFDCIPLMDMPLAVLSLGALFSYLLETQKQTLGNITQVEIYQIGNHMSLDKATLRNLEITETLYDKKVQGSLLGILDKTHTAMGSRKMKKWLREPLNDVDQVNARLDAVEELVDQVIVRNNIKEALKQIYDFQRLTGRIATGNANAKDMIALRNSIRVLPEIKECLSYFNAPYLKDLNIFTLDEVLDSITRAIVEDPPFTIKEGGIIKEGFSKELDDLKFSIKDGKAWISSLEATEKERTGIQHLKVGFNKVFGYYIEVSNSNVDMVPEEYIRKQTLVGGERYITPELKEMESLVLNAETKINQLEYNIFTKLREDISKFINQIQTTSNSIATLDVLTSFAEVSSRLGYVKPIVHEGDEIKIVQGKHPVISETLTDGQFVSNDTYMNETDTSMLLLTGPNMAGKSTYMRQIALIVLMAQAGCFVPCEGASIGVVDRIFTRIGASDNLSQGQSTFFVEMNELSYILNCATEKSLVILDEIGRGTSTYDGLSIAWAVVEYLCNENTHIRTLFATHYHELTALEDEIKGVKNLNVDVSEENGNVIFLHKIVEGSASRSYGIHVAKLAGVPKELLNNAQIKLNSLEKGDLSLPIAEEQISFFAQEENPAISRIRDLDIMNLSPIEAFKILEELKSSLK
ncbi:MAG: DNA mismatch repair protein MutS [Clostridia bacterium]|nr:DNA mismatch repair protein MutS [Clostridia bacterium]